MIASKMEAQRKNRVYKSIAFGVEWLVGLGKNNL